MATRSPGRKLTYADFARIPEDRLRHEILDGVHVVTPTPYLHHQRVSGRLLSRLADFIEAHDLGEILPARLDVLLSEHDIVEPDLLFVSTNRSHILTDDNVQGAPDLLIEILSDVTRERDLGVKRERYELLGVLEYWAFDPDDSTALVFRRQREGEPFLPPIRLSAEADDRLTSPLFPGLEISLREVFKRPAAPKV